MSSRKWGAVSHLDLKQGPPRSLACVLAIVVLGWTMAGCGGDSRVLTAKETESLLRQLPYRYKFRRVPPPEGMEAALVGRARGRHHTVLNFGIALGDGSNPVLPYAGVAEIDRQSLSGFIFTGDSMVLGPDGHLEAGAQFKTRAQWHEVIRMEVLITDILCREVTGEHCPAV